MNKRILTNIIATVLIFIAVLPPINIPLPKPTPNVPSVVLDVERPTQDIIDLTKSIDSLVTNKIDRTNLAVFSYVFSNRVTNYEIDVQKINDLLVLAGEDFFQGSLSGKYKDLDVKIKDLIVGVTGDDNHILTTDEKLSLKNIFSGLAWSLIQ